MQFSWVTFGTNHPTQKLKAVELGLNRITFAIVSGISQYAAFERAISGMR